MSRSALPLVFALLASTAAAAQPPEDDGYETPELPQKDLLGSSRFSLMTGWRYAPNGHLIEEYYARPKYRDLERARGSLGGPLVMGSFAFSPINLIEVGVDVYTTYERLAFPGQPALNMVGFGAIVDLRFQHKFELGGLALVPSVGFLLGPTLVASYFDGGKAVENAPYSLGVSAGASLHLSERWGLRFDYRLVTGRGEAEGLGPFNAGGSWLSVGINYQFPKPSDSMGRMF